MPASNSTPDFSPQIHADIYVGASYDHPVRFASYGHQVNECMKLGAKSVLLVGVGSGVTVDSLVRRGVEVTTLDIDAHLGPDRIGSVHAIPAADGEFDVAICCQVLEHLPLAMLDNCLRELLRVARHGVVVSLPDQTPCLHLKLQLLGWSVDKLMMAPAWMRWRDPVVESTHCWEIGVKGITDRHVRNAIATAGGLVSASFRCREYLYHRFYRIVHAAV